MTISSRVRKAIAAAILVPAAALALTGCDDATVVSQNLSKAADNFEVSRRVVFFNGITDTYLLTIEGLCSITDQATQLEVTCKVGEGGDQYKKHFLGLSDNVSYFVEQMESVTADPYHYRVIFKPESIIPDIEMNTSGR